MSARNIISRARYHHHQQQQQQATAVDDLDNPLSTVMAMYNLEEQSDDELDSNHVVVHQHDNFISDDQLLGAQLAADLGEFSLSLIHI